MDTPPDRATLAVFLGAVTIGGVNYVAVRYSNRELDPLWGAGLRFALAAALFAVLCAALRVGIPRGRSLRLALAYGLLAFGAAYGCMYWAMQEVQAGTAAVVFSIGPLLVLLLAAAHGLERLSVRALAGAVIAFAGSAVIFVEPGGEDASWTSYALVLLAALAASESVVVSKLAGAVHPAAMNLVGMTVGAAALLIVAPLAGERLAAPRGGETQLAVVYLVVGTVGLFLGVLYVVGRWSASATSYTFVLMPVVAVVAGALLADEPITWAVVAGGAIVLAGVWLGALSRQRPSEQPAGTRYSGAERA